jgi:integrase/recombinase XerD
VSRTPANKGRRYPPKPLKPDDARALVRAPKGSSPTAVRTRALVATLYRAGLRASEVLNLYPGDVNLSAQALHIRGAKGSRATELTADSHNGERDRSRYVPIDGAAVGALAAWIGVRADLGFGDGAPLFCSLSQAGAGVTGGGRRLDTSYLRKLLPRLARQAGLTRRVSPHSLRHTRAREWADAGLPVHQVRDLLGHASLATTDNYLRSLGSERYMAGARDDDWTF